MGSSIVTMCLACVSLIESIMAAIVVVLPDPVGPVTSTRPRGSSVRRRTTGGRPRASNDGVPGSTRRSTSATVLRWRKTLTRNRPAPPASPDP